MAQPQPRRHQQQPPPPQPPPQHSLSLKVLRLSPPTLATQTSLPRTTFGNGLDIAPNASLAFPSADEDSTFPLTAALTLPAAFGAAYVGETFTCTLCINNELPGRDEGAAAGRTGVSGIKIVAELQTPSRPEGIPLQLDGSGDGGDQDGEDDLLPGHTLQRTLHHELKDEGPHVLAVTVSYTETLHTPDGATATATTTTTPPPTTPSETRARTFRKLYQFVSQPLLAVRSKVTERKLRVREKVYAPRQWILEAQLENVGEASIVLEKIWLKEKDEDLIGIAINGGKGGEVLKPQDVEQVLFLVRERGEGEEKKDDREDKDKDDGKGRKLDGSGKMELGQLHIDWRGAMGEKGRLTTGWLAMRGR